MEEDTTLVTREQYIEMLIDASFGEASEMDDELDWERTFDFCVSQKV